MIDPILSRRHFNHSSLISLLAAAAMPDCTAAAQQQATSHAATRQRAPRRAAARYLAQIGFIKSSAVALLGAT